MICLATSHLRWISLRPHSDPSRAIMRGSRLQICSDLMQEVIRLRLRSESHKVKLPFLGREVSQKEKFFRQTALEGLSYLWDSAIVTLYATFFVNVCKYLSQPCPKQSTLASSSSIFWIIMNYPCVCACLRVCDFQYVRQFPWRTAISARYRPIHKGKTGSGECHFMSSKFAQFKSSVKDMFQLLDPLRKLSVRGPHEVGNTVAEVAKKQGPGLTVSVAARLARADPPQKGKQGFVK